MRHFLKEKPYILHDSATFCTKFSTSPPYLATPKNISVLITLIHHLPHLAYTPLHMRNSGHPDQ